MSKTNMKQSALQQRLAECERGAQLIKQLFEAGNAVPDFLTDAVFDAIHAAAGVKGVSYWMEEEGSEGDFDLDGLASLFFVTKFFSLRGSPEGLAYHVEQAMANSSCPTVLYNAIGEALCVVGSGAVADSAPVIALQLRAFNAREESKVA